MGLLREAGALAFTDGLHAVRNAQVMRNALSYAKAFDALIIQAGRDSAIPVAFSIQVKNLLNPVGDFAIICFPGGFGGSLVEAASGVAEDFANPSTAGLCFRSDGKNHRPAFGWIFVPRMTAAFLKISLSSLRSAFSRRNRRNRRNSSATS